MLDSIVGIDTNLCHDSWNEVGQLSDQLFSIINYVNTIIVNIKYLMITLYLENIDAKSHRLFSEMILYKYIILKVYWMKSSPRWCLRKMLSR